MRMPRIPRPCDDKQERAAARLYRQNPDARAELDRLQAESESWPRTERSRQRYLAQEREIVRRYRTR